MRFQIHDKGRTVASAVKNFNLEAEKGELTVLVGPPGSGKTTTRRMIAGLEAPSEGEIIIDGRRLENARIETATVAKRVTEVSDFLGLVALMDRQPRQLSGGQHQRVAVGRALVR